MKKSLIIILILIGLGLIGYFSFNPLKNLIKNYIRPDESLNYHVSLPGKLFGELDFSSNNNLDPEKIVDWTNKYRLDNNLPLLTRNKLLEEGATRKVNDMFSKQYFEHISPIGTTPSDLVLSVGYTYRYTGENLAMGNFTDEKALVDAWMASPGHRANILNKNYIEIGVDTDQNDILGYHTWLSVQEFGSPAPNCPSPSKQLKEEINSQENELNSLEDQHKELRAQYDDLIAQANDLIKQGNEIYQSTKNLSQAQSYYDQGKIKQTEAEQILLQAREIEKQMLNLQANTSQDIVDYNLQVNTYNECIH